MITEALIEQFRVKPNSNVNLKEFPTDWAGTEAGKQLGKEISKQRSEEVLARNRKELESTQELLYASNSHSVLLIFQAMDAAGKDGTIRHVRSGVDPHGCQLFSFKKP